MPTGTPSRITTADRRSGVPVSPVTSCRSAIDDDEVIVTMLGQHPGHVLAVEWSEIDVVVVCEVPRFT
ncbi:hypothetical protein, partial [Mycobacterium intracellulare]|uniref:hypothetical protein n=1 Tax=Mycobacterium intracellulare TaxID=1767 RepID=UPI001F3C3075